MAYVQKPKRGPKPGPVLAELTSPKRRKAEKTSLGMSGSQGRQAVREAKGESPLGATPSEVKQAQTARKETDKEFTKVMNRILRKDVGSKTINKVIKQLRKKIDTGKTSGLEKPMAMSKKGGIVSRKAGGTIKKQVGGLTQGYDARLDESLAARHPAVRGNLAARRAESEGMERALGRGPYSGARTMAKKGGSVSRKKGGTASRKGGGKIMVGYKAGGKV